ncbi:MAG: hypothetical protein P1V81_00480 [Planctomycetota bacterium]|nr:hypothetical protein [Planctomycetota bacterium]
MTGFQDDTLQGALARLRSGASRVLFGRAIGLHLPLALFVAGVGVLGLRFLVGLDRGDAAWPLLLVLLAPVTAWIVAQRQLPDEPTLVAWLDRRSGGTGRLIAEYDLGDSRWLGAAQSTFQRQGANQPAPVGEGTTLWSSLPAALFVGLAMWFSPPAPGPALPLGLFESTLDGLTRRLERAMDQGMLDPGRVDALAQRLEEIAGGLEQGGLEQAFEAMDRFTRDLDEDVDGFAEELAAMREALESISPETKAQLGEALSKALSNPATAALAKSAAQAMAGMDPSALDPAALMNLDSEAIGELQAAVSEALAGRLGDLAQAGFLSQSELASALARRGKFRDLKDFKEHHCEDCSSKKGGL